MAIANRIYTYVRDNKIAQNKLAAKAGLTDRQMCLILKGKRRIDADEYVRICDALCVPYDKFAH